MNNYKLDSFEKGNIMTVETIKTETLGDIVIAPEVLEVIIGITAAKIDGVYALRNKRFTKIFGKQAEGRGVYIESKDDEVNVDLYVFLTYGVKVPKVAMEIQKEVKEAVLQATDMEIDNVNIHVVSIVSEKLEKPAFENLFDEGFFDAE